MDHSLSLPSHQHPVVPSASIASLDRPAVADADDEPDSPGRSPRFHLSATAVQGSDPLAETLGQLGGVLIGLLSVLVPMAAVLDAPSSDGGPAALVRSGAAAGSPENREPETQRQDR